MRRRGVCAIVVPRANGHRNGRSRDESGPAGAPTVRTTIQLHGSRHNPTTVTARAATAQSAVSSALRSVERRFRRDHERSRTKRTTP